MRSSWTVKKPFGPFYKILVIFFLVIVALIVGVAIWFNQALGVPGASNEKKVFVIKKGEITSSFTGRLFEDGLIKNQSAFRAYIKISGLDKKIQAGSFEIPRNIRGEEVALLLTEGRFDKWLTVIEGLRKEEIAERLNKEFNINEKEFLSRASEGYLFPDTYLIPINPTTDQVLSIFEKAFYNNVTEEIINLAKNNGLTMNELIIIASIIEREAREDSQRPTIAGILIKRWKEDIPIGADATVQYILGYSGEEKTWWRKVLTAADLEIDSKYNTRKYAGLPPGPIASPGASSIKAAAMPKDSPYLFYLHDNDGVVRYAKTLVEHEQNIVNYLR